MNVRDNAVNEIKFLGINSFPSKERYLQQPVIQQLLICIHIFVCVGVCLSKNFHIYYTLILIFIAKK